ncbi:hypothetical protein CGZ80_18440 [Rhodopirellula sp. MGV]|nr:hypothetical protein CGZ80_18440 [Rhodopirellula sp. MGV]
MRLWRFLFGVAFSDLGAGGLQIENLDGGVSTGIFDKIHYVSLAGSWHALVTVFVRSSVFGSRSRWIANCKMNIAN